MLVALPQSPEARRPDRFPRRRAPPATGCSTASRRGESSVRKRPRRRVASRSLSARKPFPELAAHAAEEAVAADPKAKTIRLAIDARLQAKLEALAKEGVARLGPKLSAAIVVIDNAVRRGPRPGRRGRRRRCLARRGDRHVPLAALARLGAEAFHLRARLRGGPRPSRDGAVRPAGALRRLRAGEFRPRLPGHGDGAQGAADVA